MKNNKKINKKILVVVLALILVTALGVPALAEGDPVTVTVQCDLGYQHNPVGKDSGGSSVTKDSTVFDAQQPPLAELPADVIINDAETPLAELASDAIIDDAPTPTSQMPQTGIKDTIGLLIFALCVSLIGIGIISVVVIKTNKRKD